MSNEELIDRFAVGLAQGILSANKGFPSAWELAYWSYKYAEIMVTVRNKRYNPKCTSVCNWEPLNNDGLFICTECCKVEVKPHEVQTKETNLRE